jgi:CheY-like chemotaxis protein
MQDVQRRGPIVLVAEDNRINQRVARAQLEKLGFEVEMVANGQEAVTAVTARSYALVLMDCQMPELDGFQATALIRAAELPGERIPIIAMTANALEGDREACLAAGMDDYVSKPITIARLQEVIERVLHTMQV